MVNNCCSHSSHQNGFRWYFCHSLMSLKVRLRLHKLHLLISPLCSSDSRWHRLTSSPPSVGQQWFPDQWAQHRHTRHGGGRRVHRALAPVWAPRLPSGHLDPAVQRQQQALQRDQPERTLHHLQGLLPARQRPPGASSVPSPATKHHPEWAGRRGALSQPVRPADCHAERHPHQGPAGRCGVPAEGLRPGGAGAEQSSDSWTAPPVRGSGRSVWWRGAQPLQRPLPVWPVGFLGELEGSIWVSCRNWSQFLFVVKWFLTKCRASQEDTLLSHCLLL